MAISYLNREELQSTLSQLEQALYNHIQWYNALIRTISCRLPSNKLDTKSNAYKNCLFGQWYYNDSPKKLQAHPGFTAIGEAHRYMHQVVANLLLNLDVTNHVDPHEYDNFANAMKRLRLEIASLKHELEMALYTRDPLTGAINRVDMFPVLRELQEMVKRNSQVCSMVMMDFDFFKDINDKYGHAAGDKVLVASTAYMTEHLRPYDKLFRYGGEEFLICMQQTELMSCFERAEALREGLADLLIDIGRSDPIQVTASFGITLLAPDITIEESLERADKALYAAKAEGRNCSHIWNQQKNPSQRKDKEK